MTASAGGAGGERAPAAALLIVRRHLSHNRVLGAVVAAAALVITTQAWAGRDLSLVNVGTMLVGGLFLGSVYALLATGLVVSNLTSGIFNLAHGALAMILAFLYWELRVNREWNTAVALVVVLFVFAPVLGLLVERLVLVGAGGVSRSVSPLLRAATLPMVPAVLGLLEIPGV